jgi:hypothetical protein
MIHLWVEVAGTNSSMEIKKCIPACSVVGRFLTERGKEIRLETPITFIISRVIPSALAVPVNLEISFMIGV